MHSIRWTIVVPVRLGPSAKRRLAAPSDVPAAMAADCLAAVARTPDVQRLIVVTADGPTPTLPDGIEVGVEVVRQPPASPGLISAIGLGLAVADGRTAVLLADLPALRPSALAHALQDGVLAAGHGTWHVPDADGIGTVLLAGSSPDRLPLRFGPDSARSHAEAGSRIVHGQAPGLRRDVDTAADLAQAWQLGVGPATAATISDVQVTVLHYSTDSGTGEVVTDDGLRLPLTATALQGSGLRQLRSGQRLSCLVSERTVVAVRINGIGDPLPSAD